MVITNFNINIINRTNINKSKSNLRYFIIKKRIKFIFREFYIHKIRNHYKNTSFLEILLIYY